MLMKTNELLPMLFASSTDKVLEYTFPQSVCLLFILGIMAMLLFDDDTGGVS